MKLKITPNLSIDNKKVLGLLENIHEYRSPFKRFIVKPWYAGFEYQYEYTYEILITKENVSFYIGFEDRLKDNIETELNICWESATFTKDSPNLIFGETKNLELAEHYFLSLKTDLRGLQPLSNLLESQNILRDDEEIIIRLVFEPISPTFYRELESHIKNK